MNAPINWFGGKGRHKKWIISNLTKVQHTTFVDAFGGAGNIILNMPKSDVEVYNDMNGYLVNLYRVLRDQYSAKMLKQKLDLTLYSRAEFCLALKIMHENPIASNNPIECAWAMYVAYRQGFGGKANTEGDWGREVTKSTNGKACNVNAWLNNIRNLNQIAERCKDWQIDNRPAIDVVKNYDSPSTLTYLDPPYPLSTRNTKNDYAYEMTDTQHLEIAQWAKQAKGKVAISSYPHPIYDTLDFRRVDLETKLNFQSKGTDKNRTECLYMNWDDPQLSLF